MNKRARRAGKGEAVDPNSFVRKCRSGLEFLARAKPSTGRKGNQDPAEAFDPCSPPDKTPPQFLIRFRRAIPVIDLSRDDPDRPLPNFTLACVKLLRPSGLQFHLGLDLSFDQVWNLTKLALGDLSSTISLAPLERLTLEFQTSQRRLLEQTALDSAEEMTSTESTTVDKEVVNVARSSSKTENWHVDGKGGFDIGIFSIGAGGGGSGTTTDIAQDSIQQITEATEKSAHSLKTLHKIEVRGVTESLTQNRMTRVIKNPYDDRALSLNIFQLVKNFSVLTRLAELRSAIVIQVKGLSFDNNFVMSNSDFLTDKLLDQSLADELPAAIRAANALFFEDTRRAAIETAKLALRYLYNDPPNEFSSNIFNAQDIIRPGSPGAVFRDANDPKNSFDARVHFGQLEGDVTGFFDNSGLAEAIRVNLGASFTVLNLFFRVYQEKLSAGALDESAIEIAESLSGYLAKPWGEAVKEVTRAPDIQRILDQSQYTEIFRRLTGFLAIISGMLDPLIKPADQEKQAIFALERLKRHLDCHKNYYIQQFLIYLARTTNNQAILDFVNQVVESTRRFSPQFPDLLRRAFDVERCFISKQTIIVPGIRALDDAQATQFGKRISDEPPLDFRSDLITPTVANVEVPCDGIHLEATPGLCVMPNVPQQPTSSIYFTIRDASLRVNEP